MMQLKPSEIILGVLIILLILFSIMNKMRSTTLIHESKYKHIIDCNSNFQYQIEADTVDNTIFYRLY